MTSNFQVLPLPYQAFSSFFTMSNAELEQAGALKMTVDKKPGFPCRVSLEDTEVGEEVILVSYQHHQTTSPYQSGGAIFVRKNARPPHLDLNEIPVMLNHRLLSVRAYDNAGLMKSAIVIDGQELSENIQMLFSNETVEYLHIHNAKQGCYNCLVERR